MVLRQVRGPFAATLRLCTGLQMSEGATSRWGNLHDMAVNLRTRNPNPISNYQMILRNIHFYLLWLLLGTFGGFSPYFGS
jgi:hypothetical protein